MSERIVKIGCGAGFVLDSANAVPQMLQVEGLHYIVLEYLAEAIMARLALQDAEQPGTGFSPDLVNVHVAPYLAEILRKGIKVVTNAGGMDPRASAAALERAAVALGLKPRIAVVEGDDVRGLIPALRARGQREMYTDAPLPEKLTSANAYLGAFPIAAALAKGADIVITGRVVDSAITLGPLIHEFGWKHDDYDRLAAGTAAGHLLECGAQAVGGTFTDWREVPDWTNIGYPIAECRADGSFVLTKPKGTGGLVSLGTVGEQLVYEIGDPQAYLVPDVTCDFSAIRLEPDGADRIRVSNARGLPPTSTYKVCATYDDGWQGLAVLPVLGMEAAQKATRMAEALLARTRAMLRRGDLADFKEARYEVLGADATYGAHAGVCPMREVVCRLVVHHRERQAAELFARETRSVGTNFAPGVASGVAPSSVTPVYRLYSFLLEKRELRVTLSFEGRSETLELPTEGGFRAEAIRRPAPPPAPSVVTTTASVPLVGLAWARSGDKGDLFNVGVIARRPEYLPYLRAALTPEAVARWYTHLFADPAAPRVERYDMPGIDALNLVVHDALGGGQTAGLRVDPNGKGMAQQLLGFPVPVPDAIAAQARARIDAIDFGAPYRGAI